MYADPTVLANLQTLIRRCVQAAKLELVFMATKARTARMKRVAASRGAPTARRAFHITWYAFPLLSALLRVLVLILLSLRAGQALCGAHFVIARAQPRRLVASTRSPLK